jgi:alpha-tubulin suppressor-like RCC1 family protein
LVLGNDGTVTVSGTNRHGQLGLGDTDDRDTFTVVAGLRSVVDIDAGDRHTIAVTCEGGLWTWGRGPTMTSDLQMQWLVPTKVTGGGIEEAVGVQVAAGNVHSMARTATGVLYSWGEGSSGELGHGDKEESSVPRVVAEIGGAVVGMAGGNRHSLVTTVEGRVLAFGSGDNGMLGLGAGVGEALTPTVIDGIALAVDDTERLERLGRLIDGYGAREEEEAARHTEQKAGEVARHAAALRRLAEDLGELKAEKSALEAKIAQEEGMEGKDGKQ